jgi:predicted RNA binding protein YcfA (HicA-like mRNA interferase family)
MMMPRPQKYRDVIKFLRSQGWIVLRQGKGSHVIWGQPDGSSWLSIPAHGEISAGIVKQLVRIFPNAPEGWR